MGVEGMRLYEECMTVCMSYRQERNFSFLTMSWREYQLFEHGTNFNRLADPALAKVTALCHACTRMWREVLRQSH